MKSKKLLSLFLSALLCLQPLTVYAEDIVDESIEAVETDLDSIEELETDNAEVEEVVEELEEIEEKEEKVIESTEAVKENIIIDTIKNEIPIINNDVNANIDDTNIISDENKIISQEENIYKDIENDDKVTENWELLINFYDRKNGIISDKNFVWDASNGSYEESSEKEIILQVNLNNRNIQKEYQVGELTIEIPNIMYGCQNSQIEATVNMSVNTSKQNGYEWDYYKEDYSNDDETFIFTNAEKITSNITSSFQISYIIKFQSDNVIVNEYGGKIAKPEEYEETCYENFESSTFATLNNDKTSESLNVKIERNYNHPWIAQKFSIQQNATYIENSLNVVDNKDDYIWICYEYQIPEIDNSYPFDDLKKSYNLYPNYKTEKFTIKTTFPNDCVVVDSNLNIIDNEVESNAFTRSSHSQDKFSNKIYCGYPKSNYNNATNNYIQKNYVELYTTYEHIGTQYSDCSELNLNLAEIVMIYDPGKIGIELRNWFWSGEQWYSEAMKGNEVVNDGTNNWGGNTFDFSILGQNLITEYTTYSEIGIDSVIATDENNEYRKLTDNEYQISRIQFPKSIFNAYGMEYKNEEFEIELWCREQNEKEYHLLWQPFKIGELTDNYQDGNYVYDARRSDIKIVGYYFIIRNADTGFILKRESASQDYRILTNIEITNATNISNIGRVYASGYIKAYDENENPIIPQQSLDNYSDFGLLAPYDEEFHNFQLIRKFASRTYQTINNVKSNAQLGTKKEMQIDVQDNEKEIFQGKATIHLNKGNGHSNFFKYCKQYSKYIQNSEKINGFEIWDLLPFGMNLESSADDIKQSINTNNLCKYFYTSYNDIEMDISDILKDSCTIEIIENYKETGRTLLHIVFNVNDNALIIDPNIDENVDYLSIQYNFNISYDAYMENSTYTNNVYADWIGNKFSLSNTIIDNGSTDNDFIDINANGETSDKLAFATSNITINSLVSCQQSIVKYVQTDANNYTTNIANSSLNGKYQYKLRINTGSSIVNHLVIYDNIEQAFDKNEYWMGSFLGVDTSFAEEQGYKIKVYYSENTSTSNLENDNSWKLYTDSVDKTKVKSLAFEYLNRNDSYVSIPKNTMTYVVIQMQAPKEYTNDYAYNMINAEWNAIDSFGNVIDGIVGLNSNIVKILLQPKTETSEEPSVSPSIKPSDSPQPSDKPSEIPIVSESPSPSPSNTPEVSESPKPSDSPEPSESPIVSESPSPSPSVEPSEEPSISPSVKPSDSPQPSDKPSESPIVSENPSPSPSIEPSETPTVSESPIPSEEPSEPPIVSESPTPSNKPSETPIVSESPQPSEKPSESPKTSETPIPSEKPSEKPTVSESPTPTPSVTPTVSESPKSSDSPKPVVSEKPTVSPSATPTVSENPSSTPVVNNTPSSTTPSVEPTPIENKVETPIPSTIDIPSTKVPKTSTPKKETETTTIKDPDMPLSATPTKTADKLDFWIVLSISTFGLLLFLYNRKKH